LLLHSTQGDSPQGNRTVGDVGGSVAATVVLGGSLVVLGGSLVVAAGTVIVAVGSPETEVALEVSGASVILIIPSPLQLGTKITAKINAAKAAAIPLQWYHTILVIPLLFSASVIASSTI